MTDYYVGIDVHKTEAQVAVLNDEGQIEEEVRVANADLDEIAQQYAGNEAALEAGSNYFTIVDTLNEYLDVTLANPTQADWIDDQTQKNDRKDAKNLARYLRMGEIPESYVPPTEFREYRARGREKFVDKRADFKNEVNALLAQAGITRSWVRDCWSVFSSSWKSQQAGVTRPRHPTKHDSTQDVRLGAPRREPVAAGSLARRCLLPTLPCRISDSVRQLSSVSAIPL